MRNITTLAVLLGAFGLAACGGGSNEGEARQALMEACMNDSSTTPGYCRCSVDYAVAELSPETLAIMVRGTNGEAIDPSTITPDVMTEMVEFSTGVEETCGG